jgi:hypothetical protein
VAELNGCGWEVFAWERRVAAKPLQLLSAVTHRWLCDDIESRLGKVQRLRPRSKSTISAPVSVLISPVRSSYWKPFGLIGRRLKTGRIIAEMRPWAKTLAGRASGLGPG